jgi:hypothetical protein
MFLLTMRENEDSQKLITCSRLHVPKDHGFEPRQSRYRAHILKYLIILIMNYITTNS